MFGKFWIALLVIASSFLHVQAAVDREQQLLRCLDECWGVDRHTSAFILNKFRPILDDAAHQPIIDDFIAKSELIGLDFSIEKALPMLPPEDGLCQAPKQHRVVFESPYVRILWGSTLPGELEALHMHIWNSLMVIIKPTAFEIYYPDGRVEVGDWPIGVYELPGGEQYSCRNIGPTADVCLRFEIK